MKIHLEGVGYEFDADDLRLSDMLAMKKYTGMTTTEFDAAMQAGDPEALRFLVWLVRNKAGDPVRYSEVDFRLADLVVEGDEPVAADGDADPTPAE